MDELLEFTLGIIFGFLFGLAIYWLPLGQFLNELKALRNLITQTYPQGKIIKIRAGTDLKPLDATRQPLTGLSDYDVGVWNDLGVDWHYTSAGWVRARILHVYPNPTSDERQDIYIACHLDIVT